MHVIYLLALLLSGPADKPCQWEEDQARTVCRVMGANSKMCLDERAKLLKCLEDHENE
jgi:hypothetical protein